MADYDVEEIEDWLTGKLPPAAAAGFEAKMRTDPALAEEVALHRLTLGAMQRLSEADLQTKVSGWLADVPIASDEAPRPSSPRPPKQWIWIIGLNLLLLVAIFWGIMAWSSQKDAALQQEITSLKEELKAAQQQLSKQGTAPLPDPAKLDSLQQAHDKLLQNIGELENELNTAPTQKGPVASLKEFYALPTWTGEVRSEKNTDSTQKILNDALAAFRASNYRQAAENAQAVLTVEPGNKAAVRLLAHSLFNLARYFEALEVFRQLRTTSLYEEEADWNILLCHWRLSPVDANQRQRFERAVKEFAVSTNPVYSKKAKALMRAEGVK